MEGSVCVFCCGVFVFFKQRTSYEVRISDWSSDVCSSDLCSPSSGCNGSCYRLRRAFAALWRYGKTHRLHPVPYKPTCHTGPFRTQFSAEVLERPRIECFSCRLGVASSGRSRTGIKVPHRASLAPHACCTGRNAGARRLLPWWNDRGRDL